MKPILILSEIHDINVLSQFLPLFDFLIFSIDESGMKKPLILQKIQEKYKIYLSYQLYVLDQQPEAFDILLSILPELQDIGRKHLYYAKKISLDIVPYADEPVLLADVFSSTKEEDITKLTKEVWDENIEQEVS